MLTLNTNMFLYNALNVDHLQTKMHEPGKYPIHTTPASVTLTEQNAYEQLSRLVYLLTMRETNYHAHPYRDKKLNPDIHTFIAVTREEKTNAVTVNQFSIDKSLVGGALHASKPVHLTYTLPSSDVASLEHEGKVYYLPSAKRARLMLREELVNYSGTQVPDWINSLQRTPIDVHGVIGKQDRLDIDTLMGYIKNQFDAPFDVVKTDMYFKPRHNVIKIDNGFVIETTARPLDWSDMVSFGYYKAEQLTFNNPEAKFVSNVENPGLKEIHGVATLRVNGDVRKLPFVITYDTRMDANLGDEPLNFYIDNEETSIVLPSVYVNSPWKIKHFIQTEVYFRIKD